LNGLWLTDQKLAFRQDLPFSQPGPGEALLRVRLAGICSTDLEMVRGYYPFSGIPGHEFVGEIISLGPSDAEASRSGPEVASLVPGVRVAGEITIACHSCENCRAGRTGHCEQRKVLGLMGHDGVFAEFVTLPLENLHPVPPSIPDEAAVFTEPLAAALEIQQQVNILPSDHVLVIGAGRLGQLIAQTLALTGCQLAVLARHPNQIATLKARGIQTINESALPNQLMDVVVEATGNPAGFELARRLVRPRGTILLKSTYAGAFSVDFSQIVVDEITLIGSRCGPFAAALQLLQANLVDPTLLIEGRFKLSEGLGAFQFAGQTGIMKVLISPE